MITEIENANNCTVRSAPLEKNPQTKNYALIPFHCQMTALFLQHGINCLTFLCDISLFSMNKSFISLPPSKACLLICCKDDDMNVRLHLDTRDVTHEWHKQRSFGIACLEELYTGLKTIVLTANV